jgi:hypothetical protein
MRRKFHARAPRLRVPFLDASAAALDPNAILFGGMWSPMTAPDRVPQ